MSAPSNVQDAILAADLSSLNVETTSDILIAVVGVTGSGKSKFLRMVTGNDKIIIGNDYNSGTSSYVHSNNILQTNVF